MSEYGPPDGEIYDWYQRGTQLLDDGHPGAAATLLARAADAEPASRSILEPLGRAQYAVGRYSEAVDTFLKLVDADPADDYAQFALGLAANRTGQLRLAAEHLALAVAMRPDNPDYARELRGIRARQSRASA